MDFWDWIKSLRRWWWIIVVFPIAAAGVSWVAAPEPEYETRWTVNVLFGEPSMANNPAYFDFIFLDDFGLLVQSGAFGDIMYLRSPEEVQSKLTREEFGEMVTSSRKAHFVEIVVSGDDPEIVQAVAETIETNAEEVANHYLVPPTYSQGPANINVVEERTEATINREPRMVVVGSVTIGVLLTSIAATGVAEWLRISYRAKYADK